MWNLLRIRDAYAICSLRTCRSVQGKHWEGRILHALYRCHPIGICYHKLLYSMLSTTPPLSLVGPKIDRFDYPCLYSHFASQCMNACASRFDFFRLRASNDPYVRSRKSIFVLREEKVKSRLTLPLVIGKIAIFESYCADFNPRRSVRSFWKFYRASFSQQSPYELTNNETESGLKYTLSKGKIEKVGYLSVTFDTVEV